MSIDGKRRRSDDDLKGQQAGARVVADDIGGYRAPDDRVEVHSSSISPITQGLVVEPLDSEHLLRACDVTGRAT
jgi:hypothetical protein